MSCWHAVGYLLLAVLSFLLLNLGMVAHSLGHEAGGWLTVLAALCALGFSIRRFLLLLDGLSSS